MLCLHIQGHNSVQVLYKLYISFEEILSRTHGNFEEENMVVESYAIIINYGVIIVIIINA